MNNNRPIQSRIRVRPKGPNPSVDGHPGWVSQSVNQYVGLCAISLAMHAFLVGVGPVLNGARSAAWWVTALGALGGLLTFVPIWGMTKNQSQSLDEAMVEAYGPIGASVVLLLYVCITFLNTYIVIRTISSVVRHFFILNASEMVVSYIVLAVLVISVYRKETQGLSRVAWLIKWLLFFAIAYTCLRALKYSYIENIFPLLGNDIPNTLFAWVTAASGYVPVLALGMLPVQTGSGKPTRFRTGLAAILIGCLIATLLMLMTNASMPPQAIDAQIVWGYRATLFIEYTKNHITRFAYMLALLAMLLLTGGNGIATGTYLMARVVKTKKKSIPMGICLCFLVALIWFYGVNFSEQMTHLLMWRLPAAALPAWITWGVLAVKRRRRNAKA